MRKLISIFLSLWLTGCASVIGVGTNPKMVYQIKGKELIIWAETYGASVTATRNLVEVGASILASDVLKCRYISANYGGWPRKSIQSTINFRTTIGYHCGTKGGDSIDVTKKLAAEPQIADRIRQNNLLILADIDSLNAGQREELEQFDQIRNEKKGTNLSAYSMEEAKQVQFHLKELGYLSGRIDGKWGNQSRAAMRSFQADAGLERKGEINAQSKQQLATKYGQMDSSDMASEKPAVVEENSVSPERTIVDAPVDEKAPDEPADFMPVSATLLYTVDVLASPNAFGEYLGQMKKGETVMVEEYSGEYARITYGSEKGYIERAALR